MKDLPKTYDPKAVETSIYQMWLDGGYFSTRRDPDKKPFTIVMPPPNVTGQLHMGHAMDCTLQDILIRFKRMQGYAALWVPGVDHAGIATQIKVEEELRKEGLSRYDLGREKFLEKVWDWKHKYGDRIVQQQKVLGSSCDWERHRFTMDEGCSRAVREVFVRLFEKGLIYRGSRIINWCPHCVTALSDAEVEYQEKPGHLWHIRYPLTDGSGWVIVATTRPETMLGDTGVAVNPNDERYKDMVGKTCRLPLVDREIPIVADEYVEMDFGTGCVKMTPAHDPNDFDVGLRHNLEVIRVGHGAGIHDDAEAHDELLDEAGHAHLHDAMDDVLIEMQEVLQDQLAVKPSAEHAVQGDDQCDALPDACGQGGSGHPQPGESQLAVDEQPVEADVHHVGCGIIEQTGLGFTGALHAGGDPGRPGQHREEAELDAQIGDALSHHVVVQPAVGHEPDKRFG